MIRVPQEQPTIRAGIDAAAPGDLVLIAPGTYFESGIGHRGKPLTLRGSGESATFLDAGGKASAGPGAFDISADPLFMHGATCVTHLAAGSPCVDTGDPSVLDPDGSRSDMGALGGPGPLSYQWRKDGVPIPGAVQPTLYLWNVTTQDLGVYDVVVSDCAGSTVSAPAALTAGLPPQIVGQPSSLATCPGSQATFAVTATSQPATLAVQGGWTSYGSGTPGTFCEPFLTPSGCPLPGSEVSLSLFLGLGGAPAVLLAGAGKASIPAFGGTILVLPPFFLVPFPPLGYAGVPCVGNSTLTFTIPLDPSFSGLALDLQASILDPGAAGGVAMTGGFEMGIP